MRCLDLSEGQVRTSQVRTGQVRTGQVRTGQDKYLKVSRTIQVENIVKLIDGEDQEEIEEKQRISQRWGVMR